MKIKIRKSCKDFKSFRVAKVKGMLKAESGSDFSLDATFPIEKLDWKIGVIVGPSGSGKTSIGRQFFKDGCFYESADWPHDQPIIDVIAPDALFNEVSGALSAVGLATVPTWLRPYPVISTGEKFRADLARIICEKHKQVVIDEFTSVVDRQIAKIGAGAFAKAWRRTGNQCVLLSCHYDILDWLQPDWVFDTKNGRFTRGCLRPRPKIKLDIIQTKGHLWKIFEVHHYLKLPRMVGATYYVGMVDGEPVAHLAVSTTTNVKSARACRLVVMPEWQGAGVGTRFLNGICQMWLEGQNRYERKLTTVFHTSHPGLAAALRRDRKWRQISCKLYNDDRSRTKRGKLGGHFRAAQGFRYIGDHGKEQKP